MEAPVVTLGRGGAIPLSLSSDFRFRWMKKDRESNSLDTHPSSRETIAHYASPICFMNVWLSQNRYSSTITPSFQRPIVHIGIL